MPRKSRHASHILMLLGILFALLLFLASIFVPKNKEVNAVPQPAIIIIQPNVQDVFVWKTYKDPIYRFEIKYPSDWALPQTQRINDPDYEYEYEADFGTQETLDGNGFEGFSLFIFPTEKCQTAGQQGSGGSPSCATQKTKISTGVDSVENIVEFSTSVYTYTLVPYIPDNGADPQFVKKAALEFGEAQKNFFYDPNLKILKPVSQKTAMSPKAPTPIGRKGKLTGAVSFGGRLVCPHPNRKPMKSPNQGKHVDEDCCPDPDEWPNVACSYKPGDYKIMLKL